MKYLKTFGLVILATAALLAFVGAGTASAAGGVLCEDVTEPCDAKWGVGQHMTFALVAKTKTKLTTTGGATLLECAQTGLTGKVQSAGTAAERARLEVQKEWLTWAECSHPIATATPGEIEVEWRNEPETKGTFFGKKIVITAEVLGVHCYYTMGTGTDLGKYTPGAGGKDGILVVAATLNKENSAAHPSPMLCPAAVVWDAEYTLTTDTALYIKKE